MLWRRTEKKIGQLLVEAEVITEEALNNALKIQRDSGERLGKILVELGCLDEEELIQYIAEQYRIPFVSLDDYVLNRDILSILPDELSIAYGVIPLDIIGDILTVGIADVPDEETFKRIEELTGYRIQVMLVTTDDFNRFMQDLDNSRASKERFETGKYVKTSLYDGMERRRFPRFDKALKIKYEFRDDYHMDSSVNISEGGVLLKSKCPIPADSYLVVRMELPTTPKDIVIISKVTWEKHVIDQDAYLIGLEFISMDSRDSKRLAGFIKSLQ